MATTNTFNASVVDKGDGYVKTLLRKRNGSQPLSDEELTRAAEDIRRMEEVRSLFR